MVTIVDGIEARIAARIRERRDELGLTLAQLSQRSGVSRAMIGKIENGQSCPTASLLGKLCAGLGVTMSSLMLAVEDAGVEFAPAGSQPTWRDPETRLARTVVSPPTPRSNIQVARLWLPGGARVDYGVTPVRAVRQHILMLEGLLDFTIGGETTRLAPGDCLFALIDRPTAFFVPGTTPAEYLVIQEAP